MLFLHRIVIADFVFLLIISAIPAGHFGNFRRQPGNWGRGNRRNYPFASFCLPIPMIAPYTSRTRDSSQVHFFLLPQPFFEDTKYEDDLRLQARYVLV
jgi:hypothetical protein